MLLCRYLEGEERDSPYLGTDAMIVGRETVAAVADGTSPQFTGIIHESMWIQNGSTGLAWHRIIIHDLKKPCFRPPTQRTPGFGISVVLTILTMRLLLVAVRFSQGNIAELSDIYRNDCDGLTRPARNHSRAFETTCVGCISALAIHLMIRILRKLNLSKLARSFGGLHMPLQHACRQVPE